jgi:hypothetical protein
MRFFINDVFTRAEDAVILCKYLLWSWPSSVEFVGRAVLVRAADVAVKLSFSLFFKQGFQKSIQTA